MSLTTIIGRGHSGTRAMSHTLSASGVFMGDEINPSGDLIPPGELYEACRVLGKRVVWRGDQTWDFEALRDGTIDDEFERLVRSYLKGVLANISAHKGWKLPETTLVYPWIVRLFPEANYIFWVRNPYDCILGGHLTDDLGAFGVPCAETEDVHRRRAISWRYQYDIVKAFPRPARALTVRFEDFVLRQEETLGRLEAFLGFPLARIPVRPETVGRWRSAEDLVRYPFLDGAMAEYGYEGPEAEG